MYIPPPPPLSVSPLIVYIPWLQQDVVGAKYRPMPGNQSYL